MQASMINFVDFVASWYQVRIRRVPEMERVRLGANEPVAEEQ